MRGDTAVPDPSGPTARWRFPELLSALEQQTDTDRGLLDVADAWLYDLAHPPRDPAQVLQGLIARDRYRIVDRLLDDADQAGLAGLHQADLRRMLAEARTAAEQRRRREAHELQRRAQAVGVALPTDDPTSADRIQLVAAAEDRRATELRDRLRALHSQDAEFDQLVRDCIDAGDYPAAERLLAAGPGQEIVGGPALVPTSPRWPYRESTDTILGWYGQDAEIPPDFDLRRPPPDDPAGTALVEALRAVWARLDEATARALADAVDGLIADGPMSHYPTATAGGGFQVRLLGLVDPRLPWLGLPARVVLTVGREPPGPSSDEMALWLPLADDVPPPPDGVVLVTGRRLLELTAPRFGRPHTMHSRRINLIRSICLHLPATSVVRTAIGDLGPEEEMREAVAWMLDLLGLHIRRPDAVLPEIVLYDTGCDPAAVRAMVCEIGAAVHRPGDLTLAELRRLRADPEAVRRIRTQVTAPLRDDPDSLAVLGALLLGRPDAADTFVDEKTIRTDLADLGSAGANPADPPIQVEHIDVAECIRRLNAAGLVTVMDDSAGTASLVRFGSVGLGSLIHDEGLLPETVEQLRIGYARSQDNLRSARIAFGQRTAHSYRHLRDNYVFAQGQLAAKANRADLTEVERKQVKAQLDRIADRIRSLNLIEQDRIEELAASVFDLTDAVAEFRRIHDYPDAPVQVEVSTAPATPETLPVRGLRELVLLAFDELMVNASRAMDRAGSPVRTLRLGVRCGDREIERVVVLDVEDSGPGFPPRATPDLERQQAGLPGGEGLRNVRGNLESCRGELDTLSEPSVLGGAHLRVTLPLYE